MKGFLVLAAAFTMALAFAAPVSAAFVISYSSITANDIGDAGIGEAQLFTDVLDIGGGQVLFHFRNMGPLASSITDVYFEDGSLLGIASLIDADDNGGDVGVDFSQMASPPNLPGANNASPAFQTTAGFLADSDAPAQPNGVNPFESLGIVFDLQAGKTYNDVIADIWSGDLRLGIHVQGFESGGSESFVNTPPVPEPTSLLLLGLGLAGSGGLAIRKRRNS